MLVHPTLLFCDFDVSLDVVVGELNLVVFLLHFSQFFELVCFFKNFTLFIAHLFLGIVFYS